VIGKVDRGLRKASGRIASRRRGVCVTLGVGGVERHDGGAPVGDDNFQSAAPQRVQGHAIPDRLLRDGLHLRSISPSADWECVLVRVIDPPWLPECLRSSCHAHVVIYM
jgi:hypothetical protein